MLLLVSATDLEMKPLREMLGALSGVDFLTSGMGPVETVLSLTRYLERNGDDIEGVMSTILTGQARDDFWARLSRARGVA